MAKKAEARRETAEGLGRSLGRLAERLQETGMMREGTVVLHLSGSAGGDYHLETRGRKVQVVDAADAPLDREVALEIRGDAETVQAIIDGEKDAAKEFFAGGIRVRGDLRYLSDVMVELGLLERPL